MQRKWKRRWQRLTKIVLPSVTAGLLLFSVYNTAYANPTGGTVTSGAASITVSGGTTTIQQTTDKTAINWQSFNIGKGEAVKFIQPSSSSIALNRVIGSDASAIYGTLSANGKVFLINPNGVLFAPGSQVNVGGLVASTLNMSDSDFMSGKTAFGGSGGSVINQGSITATNYAVLIGPQVKNEGVISAQVTGMAAGSQVSLAFNGSNLLNVTVDTGIAKGSAVNSGQILADGGLVVMSAGTKNALLSTVVNNSGVIRAQSFNQVNGVVRLEGSTVVNSGTLDASGKANGQTGGTIKVLGDNVTLTSTAAIDVSGDAGGGTALIGGAYQGKGPEYNATNTTVASGATINADGVTSGNGGQVVIWANDTTKFAGVITAQGGSESGNGGSVETSGKKTLNIADSARVNTMAAQGKTGSWLLDPTNYTVGTGGNADNYMNNSYLSTQLGSTDMNIQTVADGSEGGDITITAPVSWSSHTLNLSATRNINVKAALNASGSASLAMNYGGAVDYGLTGSGFAGKINFAGMGTLAMNNHTYTIINSLAALEATNLTQYNQYYALGSDFSLSGLTAPLHTTIDFSGAPYDDSSVNVTLDGMGHALSGLSMNRISSSSGTGLFGLIGTTGVLRNLGLTGVNVYAANSTSVGALAASNNGTISNAYVTGIVTGDNMASVGGLVGANQTAGATIVNSYSAATVNSTASPYVGGLVGDNRGGISGSYSTGNVTLYNNSTNGLNSVGGLVGRHLAGGNISDSYSTGAVTLTGYSSLGSKGNIGGLAGYNSGAITNSYHKTGAVSAAYTAYAEAGIAASEHIGGLVGLQEGGSISGSYNTANVSDRYGANIGGLVGYHKAGSITASYNSGAVSSSIDSYNYNGYVGGLAGYNAGTISNSYNSGSVSQGGSSPLEYRGGAGGLAGHNSSTGGGSIYYCYNSGAVSGFATRYGGLIYTGALPSSSYFLGSGSAIGERTAAQLKAVDTYAGWDISTDGSNSSSSVWRIYDGYSYPLLRQLLTPVTVAADSVSTIYSGLAYTTAPANISYTTAAGPTAKPGTVSGTLTYGNGTPTDASTYTLSGLYSANQQGGYDISYAPSTLTIAPKALTVASTGTTITKIYDGTMGVNLGSGNYALTGIVGSDDVSLNVTNGAYSSANVGDNIGITITSLGLSGGKASNYTLTTTASDFGSILTGQITARPLTLSGITKVYDGTVAVTLGNNYTLNNRVVGDDLVLSGIGTYNSSNVADANTVTFVNAPVLSGAAASNYNLTTASDYAGTITARPISITPNTGQSKIYGEANPALVYSVSSGSVVTGETLNGSLGYSGTNVGSYTIGQNTLTSGNNSNYNITYSSTPVTFAIAARPITITPTAGLSKIYGEADPALTYGVSGGTGTSGSAVLTGDTLSGNLAYSGTNVGNYAITQGTMTNLNNPNYNVTYSSIPVTFAITARPITITPTAGLSKIYGEADPMLTYDATGGSGTNGSAVVSGDTLIGSLAYSGTNVGNYTITQGTMTNLNNPNYNVTYSPTPVSFAIAARPITITPTAGLSKIYGDADPTLTYDAIGGTGTSGSGVVSGDKLNGNLAYSGTNVGNYNIDQNTLISSNNPNYTISYNPASTTFSITKRSLTVTANDATRYVGQTNPAFTATYSGLAIGDDKNSLSGALSLATTADQTSLTGSYAITLNGTLASPNYTVNYVDGLLTVTQMVRQNQTQAYTYTGATGTVSQTGLRFGTNDFILNGYRGREHSFNGWAGGMTAPLINIVNNGINVNRLD